MTELKFKEDFIERFSKLTDFGEYKKSVYEMPKRSIRVNTILANARSVREDLESLNIELEQVPWCMEGFYINNEDIRLGNIEQHRLGYYFVQKSVSMIPAMVLNPNENDVVLDVCSSPGGKTSHIAALMKNKGIIVANESDRFRLNILMKNLERCMVANTIVTNQSGDRIRSNVKFDKILLDAPCSGSGLIKGITKITKEILKIWNINMVRRLAKLQKALILNAYSLLSDGGTLVYSTCSLDPEEDENVVEFLLERTDAKVEDIKLNIKADFNKGIKIWPQYNNTIGFFVAKIRKP